MLLSATTLEETFARGVAFREFVVTGEAQGHREPWDQRYEQLELDPAQRALVAGFERGMRILCMTGTWCGDCALQGAAMARVAEANPSKIDLRFIPRSEDFAEVVAAVRLNAGFRVPMTMFMAEDFEPVALFGDRTLSRYRAMARKQLPPFETVAMSPPPDDPVREVLREALDEFERVQLLLRLSPRLRQKHGD
jgi:hypothetical protein